MSPLCLKVAGLIFLSSSPQCRLSERHDVSSLPFLSCHLAPPYFRLAVFKSPLPIICREFPFFQTFFFISIKHINNRIFYAAHVEFRLTFFSVDCPTHPRTPYKLPVHSDNFLSAIRPFLYLRHVLFDRRLRPDFRPAFFPISFLGQLKFYRQTFCSLWMFLSFVTFLKPQFTDK